jgi:hypothetical protein
MRLVHGASETGEGPQDEVRTIVKVEMDELTKTIRMQRKLGGRRGIQPTKW